MNHTLLLNGLVRELARLVAAVATSSDTLPSVGHLHHLFFSVLADELLEQHGRPQKVVADLFNLPLRTFTDNVKSARRASAHADSTWQLIYEFVRRNGEVSHSAIEYAFRTDAPMSVRSILRDQVKSGLLYRTGSGERRTYIAARRPALGPQAVGEADEQVVWVAVYTHADCTADELARHMGITEDAALVERLRRALERLQSQQRVSTGDGPEARYHAIGFNLPRALPEGPLGAIYDHVRAVVSTLCTRLTTEVDPGTCGGSTFRFETWPGHPEGERVEALLSEARAQMIALIDRVDAQPRPLGADIRRTTFYLGQCPEELAEARAEPD